LKFEYTSNTTLLLQFPECLAQYGEHGEILFRGQLFLDGDESFEIENPDADSLTDSHFVGEREQIRKAEPLSNGPEQIERPQARHQIKMATSGEMAGCRPQAPFRLNSEDCVDFLQKAHQAFDIWRFARVDHVDIIRLDWGTVQNRSQTTDEDELDVALA
jgi:hypothetical protein